MGTMKQSFSFTTLSECEIGEQKAGTKRSPMSDLVEQNKALKAQVKELTEELATKRAEIETM